MDLIQLILQALGELRWQDMLTAVGVYIATPLVVHIYAQYIKFDRREKQLPKMNDWHLRAIVFVACFALGTFIGWRIGGWSVTDAANHAFTVGIMYPLLMWGYMAWLKKHNENAYRKLKIPRDRTGEHTITQFKEPPKDA